MDSTGSAVCTSGTDVGLMMQLVLTLVLVLGVRVPLMI